MSRIAIREQVNFRTRTKGGKTLHHVIDMGWNHKIGKRIVNPQSPRFADDPDKHITSTYPKDQAHEGLVEKTGNLLDEQGSFLYQDETTRKTVKVTRGKDGEIIKTLL